MIKVNVSITNVSAERFWNVRKPIPPIKINTNLNIFEMEKKSEDLSLKGRAYVTGDKSEVNKIYQGHKEKKPPPPVVVQSISNVVFVESVLISRTLNIPPPIPLPQISPTKKPSEKKPSGIV